MSDEYHRIYDKRPGGIPPFQQDNESRIIVYPGEIFCRIEVAKGVLCGVRNKYKTSNALKLHIRLKHIPGVTLAPLKAGKPTAEILSKAAEDWYNCTKAIAEYEAKLCILVARTKQIIPAKEKNTIEENTSSSTSTKKDKVTLEDTHVGETAFLQESKTIDTVLQNSLSTSLGLVEASSLVLSTESILEEDDASQPPQYITKLSSILNQQLNNSPPSSLSSNDLAPFQALNKSLSLQDTTETASQSVPRKKTIGRKDIYEDFGSPKRKTQKARLLGSSSTHSTSEDETGFTEKYSLKPDYWAIRQDKPSVKKMREKFGLKNHNACLWCTANKSKCPPIETQNWEDSGCLCLQIFVQDENYPK